MQNAERVKGVLVTVVGTLFYASFLHLSSFVGSLSPPIPKHAKIVKPIYYYHQFRSLCIYNIFFYEEKIWKAVEY